MKRRLKRALTAAALAGTVVAATAGWAAGNVQQPVTGPPPGTHAWRADTETLGRRLPDPASAAPERIGTFFDGLSGRQRQALAQRHPLVVGNLDGAPTELRYAANRRALRTQSARQRRRATDPSRTPGQRERAREKAARYSELLAPGRRILAFDPRGRGQVAEVFGDLEAARRTAVIVPGSDIDLDEFDRAAFAAGSPNRYGTPAGMALSLRARMATAAPRTPTAVIAWAGYTTPVGLGPDAATARLAAAGAPRLDRFLRGLARTGAPAPAVLCHSYGSVVCGRAAASLTRREASDLVVFGSPGLHGGSVRGLGTPVPVWAARAAGDWIAGVPNVNVLGVGHGTDPVSDEFGARTVSTAGAEGHTGYLAPGTESLANFARITLRSYEDVECAERDAPTRSAGPSPAGACGAAS